MNRLLCKNIHSHFIRLMSIAVQPFTESTTTDQDVTEGQRRNGYASEFKDFANGLNGSDRKTAGSASKPDWDGKRAFALPVNADSAAFSTDPDDPVFVTLDELSELRGSLPKIALWLNDKIGLDMVSVQERFRLAIARICDAKDSRREAHLVSLAIGLNLSGNANGFEIARHFKLRPQTFHEALSDTCKCLGVAKPLAKVKKDRYRKTQYSHSIKKYKAA
jgi:hypothetical protein